VAYVRVHLGPQSISIDDYHDSVTADRRDLTGLRACFGEFTTNFSPKAIAVAIIVTLGFRLVAGNWTWRDAVAPFVIIALQPFIEWVIHKYLLHLKPLNVLGREFDIYTAKAHRRHHRDPAKLDRVLLKAPEILAAIATIAVGVSFFAWLGVEIAGGSPVPVILTALLCSYIGLGRYEWSHFLIHTPYVPKSKFFKRIWRNHRLHHFKHEGYWLGVSSNFGDRLLRTNPNQSTVPKSETARTLGVDQL
jgi:hypothetical protein